METETNKAALLDREITNKETQILQLQTQGKQIYLLSELIFNVIYSIYH